MAWRQTAEFIDFNPRSPCGERRFQQSRPAGQYFEFQSTLPVWGATPDFVTLFFQVGAFQSTLPVWGATKLGDLVTCYSEISIHAPRVGSDRTVQRLMRITPQFQSTLPVWGATAGYKGIGPAFRDFNPRSPCGERRHGRQQRPAKARFQSTLPVWGATGQLRSGGRRQRISIHAPRVGSDMIILHHVCLVPNFNPRSPCGERPYYFFVPNRLV